MRRFKIIILKRTFSVLSKMLLMLFFFVRSEIRFGLSLSNLKTEEDIEKMSAAIKLKKKYLILLKPGQVWVFLSTHSGSRDALQGFLTGLLSMNPGWSKVDPSTILEKLEIKGWCTDRLAIQTEGFTFSTFTET